MTPRRASLKLGVALSAWCIACTAAGSLALAATVLPGASDAGRIQERTETPETPTVHQGPPVIENLPEQLPPAPAGQGFVLKRVVVDGATVLTPAELAAVTAPYLGQRVNLTSLNFIAGRITEQYRMRGYVLSTAVVPAQTVKDGVVHIAVIEGYVAQILIEGEPDNDHFDIIDQTEQKILAMRPLHGPTLDRYVQLLNDLGGVHVAAILQPIKQKPAPPGGVAMVLQFTKTTEPRNSLLINNYGSRYSGPWEATASTQVYSLASAFDTLTLTGLASQPLKETKYAAVGYSLPVDDEGTKLLANISYAHAVPGFSLKAEDIVSNAAEWSAGLSHAFIRQRATTLTATAMFDSKDVAADILAADLYRDHIRALRFSGHLEHADTWYGSSLADVTFSQGLRGLGASRDGSLDLSRTEGRSDFTKVEGTISRLQNLGYGFDTLVMATGQYAWSPLLSSEEFGYGGQVFGRAYDPSEILGDDGAAASAELRYNNLPHFHDVSFQPFGFYDIGKVWNIATGGKEMSGASLGGGLRVTLDSGISGSIYGAFPMTRPQSAPLSGNGRSMRLLMQVGWRF